MCHSVGWLSILTLLMFWIIPHRMRKWEPSTQSGLMNLQLTSPKPTYTVAISHRIVRRFPICRGKFISTIFSQRNGLKKIFSHQNEMHLVILDQWASSAVWAVGVDLKWMRSVPSRKQPGSRSPPIRKTKSWHSAITARITSKLPRKHTQQCQITVNYMNPSSQYRYRQSII